MSYCDLPPDVFTFDWRKARKDHRCCECREVIPKGEVYGIFSGLWDGEFSTHKQHLECEEACVFIRDIQGECLCFGELFENWCDWSSNRKNKKLRSVLARARWREKKGRPLTWLKTTGHEHQSMKDLFELRKRKSPKLFNKPLPARGENE